MNYKIEKDVPISGKWAKSTRKTKYPFGKMKKNDSFYVPDKEAGNWAAPYAYGRDHNKTFVVRSEGKGVRVWRVK